MTLGREGEEPLALRDQPGPQRLGATREVALRGNFVNLDEFFEWWMLERKCAGGEPLRRRETASFRRNNSSRI